MIAKRRKPRRVSVDRDEKYRKWLKTEPCVACIASGDIRCLGFSDPAHTAKNNGRSSKGSDSSCIPLGRYHHDEMDGRLSTKITTKQQFAEKYGLDLAAIATEHYARFKAGGE